MDKVLTGAKIVTRHCRPTEDTQKLGGRALWAEGSTTVSSATGAPHGSGLRCGAALVSGTDRASTVSLSPGCREGGQRSGCRTAENQRENSPNLHLNSSRILGWLLTTHSGMRCQETKQKKVGTHRNRVESGSRGGGWGGWQEAHTLSWR